jgi:hypothetical protein
MKHRLLWFAAAALFLLAANFTRAQGRFEATPFVGYETSASYPVSPFNSAAQVDHFRINDAIAYGIFLDYNVTENFQAEFMWNRNNTSYSARSTLTNTYFKAFNSDGGSVPVWRLVHVPHQRSPFTSLHCRQRRLHAR